MPDLVGRLENKVTIFFVTDAIAALTIIYNGMLDVGLVNKLGPAFFRLALTPVTVKIQLPTTQAAH